MPSPNYNQTSPSILEEESVPVHPPEIWDLAIDDIDESTAGARRSVLHRVTRLSPAQQLGYGCLVIMILSAALVYCVGAATFFVRPMIAERAAVTPTPVIRPTLAPTPTQQTQPALIQPPVIPLVATPTQAPIPSREPATVMPTAELINGMTVTPSVPNGRANPTRRPSSSPTPK